MPTKSKKEVSNTPMDDADRKKRGRLLDELQERMRDVKRAGRDVPDEWREKIKTLADSDDKETLADVATWVDELPPKEYHTEEITWQTFTHFSEALLDRVAIAAMRHWLVDEKSVQVVEARGLINDILAIKGATDSPVVAMNELAKVRQKAKNNLSGFNEVSA